MSESRGQSLWPSHLGRQYAVQVGTTDGESGLASAALYDGTLLLGGARGADGFIRFQSRDNAPLWDALFQPTQPGGSCRVLGLAAFNPWTGPAERRLAFAAGSFLGEVDFLDMGPRSSAARVGFVARGEAFPSPGSPGMTGLAVFESEGVNEALCVATGPACATGSGDQKFGETQCFSSANLLGVGGYFTAETNFQAQQWLTPAGAEDGFLHLRQVVNEAFSPWRTIRIGGAGNDRVTGVAFDRKREGVVVTGFFSDTVDFNPDGAPVWRSSSGGTDLFVARYRPAAVPNRLVLEWVYTLGGAGDDAGAGVAVDSGGNVYAAGHLRSTFGLDDVVVVRLDALTGSAAWVRQVQGPQNERATGVAVDGLDRALVCGWFECHTLAEGMSRGTSSGSPTPYCVVDFDPGPGQDWRSSAGGKDAFLLRLRPDGSYDGCRTWGGAQDDVANTVGADTLSWGSVAVGGTFGNAGTPPGYSMTLDPSNPPLVLTGAGNSDAYLFALEPVPGSAPLKAQLTLVLDNSGSVSPTEAAALCIGLGDALVAFDPLFPNNPPIVRRDKTAAINVILHSTSVEPWAVSLVPWTVIDATTLPLLRSRLLNLVRPPITDNVFAPALNLARSRLVGSRFNNLNVYQSLLLMADGLPADAGAVPAARAAALTGAFDQINTLVVFDDGSEPGWARAWALNTLTASIWTPLIVAPGEAPPPPNENNLGWAARVPMDPLLQTGWFSTDYGTVVGINLARSTRCPGDFDRNGVRDAGDWDWFFFRWSEQAPQADLNFGGQWGTQADLDLDRQKLRTELAVPCP